MTVYVVELDSCCYDCGSYTIDEIFMTKELAEQYVENNCSGFFSRRDYDITEWTVKDKL